VIPASVHNRETRVMKILSSGCGEHALLSHRPQKLTFFIIFAVALKVTLAVGHNQRLAEAFRGSYDNLQGIAFTDPNATLAAECRAWLDPAPSGTKACPTDFAVFSAVGTV